MIKELHGSFPQMNTMPTGGVNLDNFQDWFAAMQFVQVQAVIWLPRVLSAIMIKLQRTPSHI